MVKLMSNSPYKFDSFDTGYYCSNDRNSEYHGGIGDCQRKNEMLTLLLLPPFLKELVLIKNVNNNNL